MKKAFPVDVRKAFACFVYYIPFSHPYFSDEDHKNANDMRMKNHHFFILVGQMYKFNY